MSAARLERMFQAGLTDDEVALMNEAATGWKPHRTVVFRKRRDMGFAGRRLAHTGELLPERVRREHNSSLVRHMLQATSRIRQGRRSQADDSLAATLQDILGNAGKALVVVYYPETAEGFLFALRDDDDRDIFRHPRGAKRKVQSTARDAPDRAQAPRLAVRQQPERQGC